MKRGFFDDRLTICIAFVLSAGVASTTARADWPQLGGGAAHNALSQSGPRNLSPVRWLAEPGFDEEFVANASPVVSKGRVFVAARLYDDFAHVSNAVIAFDAISGARLWRCAVPADYFESWSSPAVAESVGAVIVATNRTVSAISTANGSLCWQRQLGGRVVNVSPTVSYGLFSEGKPANRVFITNFFPISGMSDPGTIYAINIDPYDEDGNPYQPGDIVWTTPLNSPQGATVAFAEGAVFAATTTGQVAAFDACSGKPIWQRTVGGLTCYGGVTVSCGAVYAAGYTFTAGQNNALLAKLSAYDGAIQWAVACERTDSMPIVMSDGRILLSAGIGGSFGSATKVQMFQDHGWNASLVWDTHVATGGGLEVGGWSTQPAAIGNFLCVGRPGAGGGGFSAYERLYILDLTKAPGMPGFVRSEYTGAGGSSAIAGASLYSIGEAGLVAFGRSVAAVAY